MDDTTIMDITKERLNLITGILALAFGIYCIAVGTGVVLLEHMAFSLIMLIICGIFGALYIAFGFSILRAKEGQSGIFIAAGFFFSTIWWSGGLPWYLWPMLVMPWIILGLAVIILFRTLRGRKANRWE